ncbi:MAG: exo-alpha-sialidase [Planctomycetes bacterium]|nr:exo-alpha-sialidase [Planctomycetota bacterium]MCH9725986.1 exo-alpha-sialidase [Planctomycetota bacterium]MCH9777139.1 exo-alpha-sialidase [Planctomycetota bacterium]MCH9790880.1 exo-alpha-sialidase [Planctomycetota bacterium]
MKTLISVCVAIGFLVSGNNSATADNETSPLTYKVDLRTVTEGFDGKTCWVQARTGAIPQTGKFPATIVLTMQKLLLSGSDVFYALNEMRSTDGEKWIGPTEHSTLGRRRLSQTREIAVCDFTPGWHARTKKLLGTGHSVRYENNKVMHVRKRSVVYSVYNQKDHVWSEWAAMSMPDVPEFENCGSGSAQRFDLDDGTILLPVYFKKKTAKQYSSAVVLCDFDGEKMTYKKHGSAHTVPIKRGLYEPSVTKFQKKYYLTMRNDEKGYVSVSDDGLNYSQPIVWKFDDGQELGNYNTQQHWVTHSEALFLVYTRRGANNDHVFRHRAPLFMAQVDPKTLRVIRKTERIIVPEKGARMGNFAVVKVSPHESWVTVAEWMQPVGIEKYGSNNRIYTARIKWSRPEISE